MECAPDLNFLTMAASNELYKVNANSGEVYQISGSGGGGNNDMYAKMMRPGVMIKQRKTNFTPREVEVLLSAVEKRREVVLFGTAGGQIWARAWQEVAQEVTAVEGIQRTEGDVRKKWTYLKWEAKNTSKPGRDPTSRAVLEILTGGDPEAAATLGARSLLEELLVPQQQPSVTGSGGPSSPVSLPTQPKKVTASRPTPSHSPQPQPSLLSAQSQEDQPPEVCLRWNSYHKNMQAFFPSLLNNEQFVDVTLACEGQSIKCHKVMLSACSTYFEELLSQNPCQHPIVLMKDLCFWEIQALVDFMYRGEVNVSQDKLPQLLKAAEALQIKGLAGPTTGSSSHAHDEDSHASSNNSDVTTGNSRRQRKRKSFKNSKAQMNNQQPQHSSTPVSSVNAHTPYRSSGIMPAGRTSATAVISPSCNPQSTVNNSSIPTPDTGSHIINCSSTISSTDSSSSDVASGPHIKNRKIPSPSHHSAAHTTEKACQNFMILTVLDLL
ncbi:uncharacterized protein LOC142322648 [Lycorma delicatula]|uniref:uncharacterized protein LOC142322648 n=1 Tax=Lycorma delicatula TaxID=130591 RepID=UPI003F51615F